MTHTTPDARSTLSRAIDCLEILDKRPRPMCRDCADEDGTCPHGGLACDMRALIAESRACIAHAAPAGDAVPVLREALSGLLNNSAPMPMMRTNDFYAASEAHSKAKLVARNALTATERAATRPIEGLGSITNEDDGTLTLQFKDEEAAQEFMHRYSPTVDCRDMPERAATQPAGEVGDIYEASLRKACEDFKNRQAAATPSGSTEQPAAASADGLPEPECLGGDEAFDDRVFGFTAAQMESWGAQQREAMREWNERAHRFFLTGMKELGLGDGTKGWIEHADEDEALRRDDLSLEGEILFGFERIKERIAAAEKERDDLRAQLAAIDPVATVLMRAGHAPEEAMRLALGGRKAATLDEIARPADLAGLTRYDANDIGGLVLADEGPAYLVSDVQARLAGKMTPAVAHCERGQGCVCGGDTKRVREGCGHWVPGN